MPKSTTPISNEVKDGDFCKVVSGTHKGKSGIAHDLSISETGYLTITIIQPDGSRFKTLGKNVTVQKANVA